MGLRGRCPARASTTGAAARAMPNGRRLASSAPTASRCRSGNAILLFPSGAAGPAFLVGENFEVIKRYNISDVFALAAAQIADRAQGRAGVRAAWPANDPQLTRERAHRAAEALKELGHPVNDFEGRIDFDLRDAIRLEQAKHGMVPDGHPTRELLERIGARSIALTLMERSEASVSKD